MGPLEGTKVVELAGAGPGPYCGMLLGDMGADVIRIDRLEAIDLGIELATKFDFRNRNKRSIAIDLKKDEGRSLLLALISEADILIEGYRPGVAERIGVGPADCWQFNPRLVYGRATGWGQNGPLAHAAGHDINYIALTGALDSIGEAGGPPVVPLNLLGDYAGGGAFLAYGLVCAMLSAQKSGEGQVVDAAMIDGVTSLLTVFHGFRQAGEINPQRGANMLDGGAPFYTCYKTKDCKFIAVGAIETRFYVAFLTGIELDYERLPDRNDTANWPALKNTFQSVFSTKTRDEWEAIFAGVDACVSPVLTLAEAGSHPHNVARSMLVEFDGLEQPQPAPRLSATPGKVARSAPSRGQHTSDILSSWQIENDLIQRAVDCGAIGTKTT